jgi:hypothetical protein
MDWLNYWERVAICFNVSFQACVHFEGQAASFPQLSFFCLAHLARAVFLALADRLATFGARIRPALFESRTEI